ncbi:TPA: ead/Ea22-like family protein [Klebsiella pneumoniae]|nr:ead/Ea22-like family protein [Klebsiella pneumoniae]
MTTDITELAQSLKAAAEKATQGNWRAFQYHDGRCGIGGGHHDEIMVCEHISKERPHDAMFIALANPANVLALVEALEKAQLSIAKLEREQEQLRPVGVMSEKAFHRLENSECRFIALWPRPGIFLPRKRPEDGVIVYARTAAPQEVKP